MNQTTRTNRFQQHSTTRLDRDDGSILLSSNYPLGDCAKNTGEWLHHWAGLAPDRVFIAERSGDGWREESYATTLQKIRNIAASLLARGMGQNTPILILSGNSVDNALLTLAAQYIGAPTAPLAEQYSLINDAHHRLVQVAKLVQPAMVYVASAEHYAAAIALDVFTGIEVVASETGSNASSTPFSTLLNGNQSIDLNAAHAQVNGSTLAKILMTSGSTSAPKGVMTTQQMMCVNQQQLAHGLPFLSDRPPCLVDWLPWNHVFGGSHNFNMALSNGGSLYIDDGKPVPELFDRTLENLSKTTGTLSFNVPIGYALLAKALSADTALRRRFFENLDLVFYAGASLAQDVWVQFESMAMEVKGEIPLMTSSWGLTETGPAVALQSEPIDRSGIVGVPLPGNTLKLIPRNESQSDSRYEVRVKGPNIMTAYFRDPQKSREAFDEEGFFITGDAMQFVDSNDANQGLTFDGRLSEDFKLQTGTWVRSTQLRLDLLDHLAPLVADLIVAGADRNEIGIMVFPNQAEMKRAGFAAGPTDGAISHPELLAELKERLMTYAQSAGGSSTRVTRAIVLGEPASLAHGEITAKGNLNFRKILSRRSDLLDRLYNNNNDDAIVRL